MDDYIDVFFRLNDELANTVGSCLMDEMEDLRDFHGKNESLAFKHRDFIIGRLRHRLLFDGKAKKLINQKQDINEKLSENVDARLSLENNETNMLNMDVDNVNTMVSSLRTLKLSAVERFIDDCKLNGNAVFASFEIWCAIFHLLPAKIWMY